MRTTEPRLTLWSPQLAHGLNRRPSVEEVQPTVFPSSLFPSSLDLSVAHSKSLLRRFSRRTLCFWLLLAVTSLVQPNYLLGKNPSDSQNAPPRTKDVIDESLVMLESFAAAAESQLGEIARILQQPDQISPERLAALIHDDLRSDPLRPPKLQPVFRDQRMVVQRPLAHQRSASFSGAAGLAAALNELTSPYRSANDIHVKFKTFRVEPGDGDVVKTQSYYHAWGTAADRIVEQTAVWQCWWSVKSKREPPQLVRIKVNSFEEVVAAGRQTSFVDSTLAAFGDSPVFRDQLLLGIEHWRNRLPAELNIDFRGHHGIAVGDVNQDGLDDLYLCQPGALPNRLLIQNADGTVADNAFAAGVDWLDETMSSLLLDLDNDGDQDLILCMEDRVLVMANDGSGHFEVAGNFDGPAQPHSIAAADYDNDGLLDLYVCGFWLADLYEVSRVRAAFALPTPWHDANNGAPNVLYRNLGQLRFRNVTEEVGLDQNNRRFSHAAGWEDFDNDGDLDLYVANDYGRNNLYRNDAGHFADVASEVGVEDQAAGMSVAWSDYNKDGWMDLYVSNMFSSAGGRISYHSKFQKDLNNDLRREFQRHSRGNTLFVNASGSSFQDVSQPASVLLGRWAWSSNFIDINNDGLDDLFVANGFVTNEDTKDL